MWAVLADAALGLLEMLGWRVFGPRHEPPREEMTVLGDLNSSVTRLDARRDRRTSPRA